MLKIFKPRLYSNPKPVYFFNNHSLVIFGDNFCPSGVSVFSAGIVGALRCLAGLIGPSRSNWLGLIAFGIGVGAGVIDTIGGTWICSTDSGIRGGRSA